MDNREIIAAILTAGMLPTLPVPGSFQRGPPTESEEEELQRTIGHAISLYRAVIEGLRLQPSRPATGVSHRWPS
jgi:hypothetical protein